MDADDRSMLDVLRTSRLVAFTIGTVCAAAGIVLVVWPERTIVVVARLSGLLLAVVGVAELLEAVSSRRHGNYWGLLVVRGLMNVAAGVALVVWPEITVTVLVWVVGIDLILTALMGLLAARQVPKEMGRSGLVWRSAVSAVFGLILIVWPGPTVAVLAFVIGLLLLGLGLTLLVSGWQLGRAERQALA